MKSVLSLALAALMFTSAQAQDSDTRPLKKGQNSVNVYYGVSLLRNVYKAVADNDAIGLTFKGIGPVGVVYEHMVTDVVGIGAELGYSSLSMMYDYESWDSNFKTQMYQAEWKFSTLRVMFRANFHFAKTENFDAYALVSAGYRQTTYSFSTNEPNYDANAFKFGGVMPFGIKPGIGLRYFFTPNIGIHTEFALGTPMICGGLSFRF